MKKVRAKSGVHESLKSADAQRPVLSPISDQMRAWSSPLAAEVAQWPDCTTRSFFGFTALYRGELMFGAVPRTRSFGKGNLLGFRIDNLSSRLKSKVEKDQHIGFIDKKNTRWFTFDLSGDSDVHKALDWLAEAYEAAGKRRKSNK